MSKKKIQAMTTQLAVHENFGQFRYIVVDGEIWFVGIDIAKILGYKNGIRDVKRHVDLEDRKVFKSTETVVLKIPNRGLTFINESGLYSLIFGSQLPTAKKFKRWVTSEVLPSIRKNGYYALKKSEDVEADLKKAFDILADLDAKGIDWNFVLEDIKLEYNEKIKEFRPCYNLKVEIK